MKLKEKVKKKKKSVGMLSANIGSLIICLVVNKHFELERLNLSSVPSCQIETTSSWAFNAVQYPSKFERKVFNILDTPASFASGFNSFKISKSWATATFLLYSFM